MLCRNAERWSQKSTGRCSAKQLQNFLQKCWKVLSKTADALSVKIMRSVLQKYWDVLKSTRNTSTKVQKYWQVFCEYALKYVLQNCWEEFPILTQNEQPSCENSDIGLFPVTSWFSILGDTKVISNYWERSHLQTFHTR